MEDWAGPTWSWSYALDQAAVTFPLQTPRYSIYVMRCKTLRVLRHCECLMIVQWSAVPRTFAPKNKKTRGREKKKGGGGGPVSKKVIPSFQPSGPALMGLGRTRCYSVCRKYREKEHVMEQLNRCNKSSLLSKVVNLCAYDVHLTRTSIEEAETEKPH